MPFTPAFCRSHLSFFVFAAALLLISPSVRADQGFVHRVHTSLVDGVGKPLVWRGVNLGNWLYSEPWMSGSSQFEIFTGEDGKKDEMQAAVTDLVGENRAALFNQAWRDNAVTQADIRKIEGLGFNSVRVPLDDHLFTDPKSGKDTETGFIYLDRLLAWCAESHIYVIPDMHCVPGGKLGWVKGSIYDSPEKQALLAHLWGQIAARYQNNPWIGGYDLINEPAVWNPAKLGGLYQTLIIAVRRSDSHHLIITEGDVWGSDLAKLGLSDAGRLWDSNMALSEHDYGQPEAPNSRAAAKQLAARLDLPLWMGEFGYNSNTWDRHQIQLCERAAPLPEGWCFWAWKSSSVWSLTSFDIPPAYRRLQDYWEQRNNAPKPTADAAFSALMAVARGTALSRCTLRRDVVDAFTRPDFLTRTVPYNRQLTIPGAIPAVEYDMGAEGVASHDTISGDEAGKGPAGVAWNSGWSFRNDGVDIFPHPDGAAAFAVGGIEPGEWLRYSVRCTPGTYQMRMRVSGFGGKIRVLLNGVAVSGPIAIPSTGGWDHFRTLIVRNIKIKEHGQAVLEMEFDGGGFNFNQIAFR